MKRAPLVGSALAAAGVAVWVTLIQRRRRDGGARIASTLHLTAAWWTEQREHSGDLLYVALGDSAAQGVGASRPGRGYVGIIAAHLRTRTRGTVRVVNLSVSGARLRDAIAIQLPALEALRADVITVALGANDIASFDPALFERELTTILDALPPWSIVAEIPAFYLGIAEKRARAANVIVHRLADARGLEVAPLHRLTRSQGAARYALNQVAADFFHPNDRGYRVWASAFLPLLDGLIPPEA